MLAISQLTPPSEGGASLSPLVKTWPHKEYWLLRSLLRYLSNTDRPSELLERLSTYNSTPTLMQLALNVTLLAEQPVSGDSVSDTRL